MSDQKTIKILEDTLKVIEDPDPNEYKYYKGSRLTLGAGLSPNDIQIGKIPCVLYDSIELYPGAQTDFEAYMVSNTQQLNFMLNVDNKIDASYLAFTGNTSLKLNSSLMFDSNSLTFVIKSITEYGGIGMKVGTIKLTPEAQSLVSNPKEFYERFGSKFVSIERRGASISAIITLRNVKNEEVLDITQSGSFKGGFGPLSGEANTKINVYFKRFAQEGNAIINIFSTGNSGISGLEKLIQNFSTQPDSIDKIKLAISDYVKNFNSKDSVPIAFELTSFSTLGVNDSNINLWNINEERRLRDLVTFYRRYSDLKDTMTEINAKKDVIYKGFTGQELGNFPNHIKILDDLLQKIADEHRELKAKRKKSSTQLVLEPLKWVEERIIKLRSLPNVYHLIYKDGLPITIPQTHTVIKIEGKNILEKVKALFPDAKEAKHVVVIEGYMLETVLLRCVDPSNNNFYTLDQYPVVNDKCEIIQDEFPVKTFTPISVPPACNPPFFEIRDSLERVFNINLPLV